MPWMTLKSFQGPESSWMLSTRDCGTNPKAQGDLCLLASVCSCWRCPFGSFLSTLKLLFVNETFTNTMDPCNPSLSWLLPSSSNLLNVANLLFTICLQYTNTFSLFIICSFPLLLQLHPFPNQPLYFDLSSWLGLTLLSFHRFLIKTPHPSMSYVIIHDLFNICSAVPFNPSKIPFNSTLMQFLDLRGSWSSNLCFLLTACFPS